MNKRYYEHTLPIIRGSLSNTYDEFHRVFVKPEWKVLFGDKDINTIPFMDILQSLPLQDSNL